MNKDTEYSHIRSGKSLEIERLEAQGQAFAESISKQISLLRIEPRTAVLDAGCGIGYFVRRLASLVSQTKITAIDFESIYIEHARKLASSEGISNITFEVGDVCNLESQSETFDVTYCSFVFPHVKDSVRAAKEMLRVTKKGGIFSSCDEGDLFVYPRNSLDKFFSLFDSISKWRNSVMKPSKLIIEPFQLFKMIGLEEVRAYPIPTFSSNEKSPNKLRALTKTAQSMVEIYKNELMVKGFMSEKEYHAGIDQLDKWLEKPDSSLKVLSILTVGKVSAS